MAGAVLMAAAVFTDWATVKTGAGTAAVEGLDRGGAWVLAAAVVSAIGVLAGRPEPGVVCGTLAAGFLALTAYTLPGAVREELGGYESTLGLGPLLSLLGALILLFAAARYTALEQERARRR